MNLRKLPDIRFAVFRLLAVSTCLFLLCPPGFAAKEPDSEALPEPTDEMRANKALSSLTGYLRKGDYQSAFPLVKVMAEKGYPAYQEFLGRMYMNGQGTRKNMKQAADWFNQAAKAGNKAAQSNLGRLYFHGQGVPQDFVAARKWLDLSASDGEACVLLGRIYSDGLGTDRDYSKAIDAFKRADALGTDTKIIIGILYSQGGFGVEKNYTQAKKWLELAANQKNAMAQCALGFVYLEGGYGLAKDVEKAKKYIRAARQNLEKKAASGNPAALTWLGRISYTGIIQPRDFVKARKYFETSADSDSLYMLGVMAKRGQGGLRKDFKKSMELFRRADAAGSFPAKVGIGELYYLGQGVSKNLCEAKKWFDKGGKNDDPIAWFYLGQMYAKGECCKKDLQRARAYLQRAKPALELALATNEECAVYLKQINGEFSELATLPAVAQSVPVDSESQKPAEVKSEPVANVASVQPGRDFKEISTTLEALVLEYYPRAKVVKDDKSFHFEFKSKTLKLPSSKEMLVPLSEGIVGDLRVTPGRYEGTEILPFETNETYFVSLLMAPYSVSGNNHLLTKMLFPPSTPTEFVNRFKKLLTSYQ